RMNVVEVGDVGTELPDGRGHLLGLLAAAKHRPRGASRADARRVALEHLVLDTRARERLRLELDGPFLATWNAVEVVDDQDLHATPSAGSTRSATSSRI